MQHRVQVARQPYFWKRQWAPADLLYSDIATGGRLSESEAQEMEIDFEHSAHGKETKGTGRGANDPYHIPPFGERHTHHPTIPVVGTTKKRGLLCLTWKNKSPELKIKHAHTRGFPKVSPPDVNKQPVSRRGARAAVLSIQIS